MKRTTHSKLRSLIERIIREESDDTPGQTPEVSRGTDKYRLPVIDNGSTKILELPSWQKRGRYPALKLRDIVTRVKDKNGTTYRARAWDTSGSGDWTLLLNNKTSIPYDSWFWPSTHSDYNLQNRYMVTHVKYRGKEYEIDIDSIKNTK